MMIARIYGFLLLTALIGCTSSDEITSRGLPPSTYEGDSTFLTCERTISVMSETEFVVTLTIMGSQLQGGAVINEQIPKGCRAQSIDSEAGLFDYNENNVQIVWVDFPSKDELKISYLVTVDSSMVGLQDIQGEFQIDNHSCQIPTMALEFDHTSIMVQDASDPDSYLWGDVADQKQMLMGSWLLTKVKGDETAKYDEDNLYTVNFRNDNKIAFNTNANNCTARYSLNSSENMTITDVTCSEVCCDEEPLAYPYGLTEITYYHVSKNKLILVSDRYKFEFDRH